MPGLRPLRATDPRASITIGELAQRTGVPASTLRMWEARHGFPEPVRRPSGHRRYGEANVQLVRVVMRQRAAGLSLEGAIRRVRDPDRGAPISIFGALRQRWPELRPHTVAKPVLLALTRAVEDEYVATGDRGLAIATFQEEHYYRQSEDVWRTLVGSCDAAFALADFGHARAPAGAPVEVPVGRDHPLSREWALLFHARRFAVCLVGRERIVERPAGEGARVFEVVWSADPEVVRGAVEGALDLVAQRVPGVARSVRDGLQARPAPVPEPLVVTRMTNRMVAYVSRLAGAPRL